MTLDQLVEACGWTLIHFVWQGAGAALTLACALAIIPARQAPSRCLAACVALAAMVVAAGATFAWQAHSIATFARPASSAVASSEIEIGAKTTPIVGDGPMAASRAARVGIAGDSPVAPAAASQEAPPAWFARAAAWPAPWLDWLVAGWAVGVAALCARLALNWRAVGRLRSTAQPLASDAWTQSLERLRTALCVAANVRLVASAQVRVPMAIGWLRPAIVVPVEMITGLDAAAIRAILAHELAHIRRRDYLVNVLQNIAETVLFFHPAVWWASAQIRRERECCCDAIAAQACDGPMRYARSLLAIESLRGAPRLALAATGGSLLDRVRRLTGENAGAPLGAGGAMAVVSALVAVAALAVVGPRSAVNAAPAEVNDAATASPAAPTPQQDGDLNLIEGEPSSEPAAIGPIAAASPDDSENSPERNARADRLDEQTSERLRELWAMQRSQIKTAEIRARRFLSGRQEIPQKDIEAILAKLLPVIDRDPRRETIEAFMRNAWPIEKQSWKLAILMDDGANGYEQLGDERNYWQRSKPSRRSHLSVSNFRMLPGEAVLDWPFTPVPPNGARFETAVEENSATVQVDLTNGQILDCQWTTNEIAVHSKSRRIQRAFRDFDGVLFPTVTIDVDYREGELNLFELLIVEQARFNRDFKITVPEALQR